MILFQNISCADYNQKNNKINLITYNLYLQVKLLIKNITKIWIFLIIKSIITYSKERLKKANVLNFWFLWKKSFSIS